MGARGRRLAWPGGSPAATAAATAAALLAALAVAASQNHPTLGVGAVLGMVAIAAAIATPTTFICLGALVIPLEGFFPGLVGPSQGVLGIAAIGGTVRWGLAQPLRIPRHPALVAFALLWFANACGLVFAPEPLVVLRQVVTWGILLVVAGFMAQDADARRVEWVLFALAVCGGLAGLVAAVDPQPLTAVVFEGGDVARATGGLGSPNALGMLLALLVPLQVVFAIRGRLPVMRVVAVVCCGLALLGMTLAVSRGAFVGLGAGLFALTIWAPFRRLALIGLPLVAVLALAGHNPASPIGGKVAERIGEVRSDAADNPRLVLWRKAPRMIGDRPLFGQGALEYGHYTSAYGIPATEGVAPHAHNLLLTVAVENGLIGAAALLAMLVGCATGLRRVLRRGPPLARGLACGMLASLAGFLVNGVFDYALDSPPIAAAFFLVVASAIALSLAAPAATRAAATKDLASPAVRPVLT